MALVRCAAEPAQAGADDLLAWLRTPGLLDKPGLADRLELQVRRAGAHTAEAARALWEAERWPLDDLDRLGAVRDRPARFLAELERQLGRLFANPYERRAPVLAGPELDDPRVYVAASEALAQLRAVVEADPRTRLEPGRVLDVLAELEVRLGESPQPDRVQVAGPEAIRARRFEAVFVCGLQEGEFPRGAAPEPFLPDEDRRALAAASGLRLPVREDRLDRERYLFYVCCSRAERLLVLSSRTSDEEGNPQPQSFFVEDVRELLAPGPPTRERSLSDVTWSPDDAPTAAELERALAAAGPRSEQQPARRAQLRAAAGAPARARGGVGRGARALCRLPGQVAGGGAPAPGRARARPRGDGARPVRALGAAAQLRAPARGDRVAPRDARQPRGGRAHPARGAARAERGLPDLAQADPGARRRAAARVRPAALPAPRGRARRRLRARAPRAAFGYGEAGEPVEIDPGLRVRGRIDRVDTSDGMALVIDYKSGKKVDSYRVGAWEKENRFQAALYMLVVERLLGLRAAGGVYVPLGSSGKPRGMVRDDVDELGSGFSNPDRLGPDEFRAQARLGARAGARHRRPHARRRAGLQARLLRLERRLRLSLDLPVRGMSLTPQQARAVARRDCSLMVRAGAGTGKTTVLVERFVQAVAEDGVAVESVLAITFTEKAAAEMRTRVRRRFLELGRRADARAAEAAWISTIHGFCSRVLRAHALSAGIDPDFRVLDELEAERIAADAFDGALGAFMGDGEEPERLEMVAAYTPDKLSDMVRTAHAKLRSQGERHPHLEEAQPPLRGAEAGRLDTAIRAALAELGAGEGGKTVSTAIERLERCAAVLERVGAGALADPGELDGLGIPRNAKALCSAVCDEYRAALEAYESLCRAQREYRDHTLLRALVDLYGERYERGKRARAALDFEDLQLIALELLERHEGLRDQYAERFSHVLVDEFQDTNRLQNALIAKLERDNVFRVGDERQSIYGFRHADVEVFREHWERAAAEGRAETVGVNFRSRGEVLEAIDACFGHTWSGHFEPLREAEDARAKPARVTPSVDLLVVDKSKPRWDEALDSDDPFGAAMHGAAIWRAAEARLLARHLDELRAAGGWEWRDIVLLMRATTSMGFYERALEERGIPTHVVGGRGYWEQQQVSDLRHWLAALANPLDELALFSVLASPLGGLSLDALALIGVHAKESGRDAWWTVSDPRALAAELPEPDRGRLERFVVLFEAERRAAPQRSLEALIHRAVSVTGYDLHVLGLPAGSRRMANVRKLMRMAREFEAEEGRDLRAFIDSLAERDAVQTREGEAPLEAEALDAVRLMTIHRAKGLEFPVVCVADLGKDGREDDGALRISDDGSLGLRLASLGGGTVDSERLERIKQRQKVVAEEEEKRIFYVALTRAQEHLVLSGATDLEALPEPEDLKEPMRWLWRGLPEAGVRRVELRPAGVDDVLPAPDRAAGRARARAGGRARPARAGPGSAARPARPRGQPPVLLARSGSTSAAPTASTCAARSGCRPRSRPSRLRRCPASAWTAGCAARSCTSCSSGSTSAAPPCPRWTRWSG